MRRHIWLVMVLMLVSIVIAGCSLGGEDTTTTLSLPGEGPDTTSTASTSSESTESTAGALTSTTGIVISLPSTSSTEAETTTTTEALSSAETRLANGHIKAMGYIDKVWEQGGKRYIRIDYATMLTGDAANEAAIADGVIEPGETVDNDYYISNVNPQKRTFEVSDSADITTSTRWVSGDDMGAPCTWADFKSFWGPGPFPEMEGHLHGVPWWIERDGPVVVKIDEQFLP